MSKDYLIENNEKYLVDKLTAYREKQLKIQKDRGFAPWIPEKKYKINDQQQNIESSPNNDNMNTLQNNSSK